MKKLNCWEFKKCGREIKGILSEKLGVCPAATETRLNGVHSGKNAGRACWVVAGTMCNGKMEGTFAVKCKGCGLCDFYNIVQGEEGKNFLSVTVLRKMIKK